MADRPRDLPVHDVLLLQRDSCTLAGSSLYATLLQAMADDLAAGGIIEGLLAERADDALGKALPLRFLGAVHRIVLEGRAPELARYFPSVGGSVDGDPVPAFFRVVHDHRAEIEAGLSEGVQTNEVGRSASLVGGFHAVAAETGLPLRILEVGSSAGLLLRWDHYHYDTGAQTWGDADSTVRFVGAWRHSLPTLEPRTVVAERRGCDIHPIDPSTDAGQTKLRSFLWPDMIERRHRLDAAIAIARRVPATIDTADAGEWIEERLSAPATGLATVVYHSIVLQYLPRRSFDRMRASITRAGAAATSSAPIAWLRMEPAGETADVRLTVWPGGEERRLATTAYHGPPVTWQPPGG